MPRYVSKHFPFSHAPVFSYPPVVPLCRRSFVLSFRRALVPRSTRYKHFDSTALVLNTEKRNGKSLNGSPQHQTLVKHQTFKLFIPSSYYPPVVPSHRRSFMPSCRRSYVSSFPNLQNASITSLPMNQYIAYCLLPTAY